MLFKDWLRARRKALNLSQEALGERIGVQKQSVSRWELGKDTPGGKNFAPLAQVFGVTVEEVVALVTAPPEIQEPTRRRAAGGEDLDLIHSHLDKRLRPLLSAMSREQRRRIVRHLTQQVELIVELASRREAAERRDAASPS